MNTATKALSKTLVDKLTATFSSTLVSVCVYGSAVFKEDATGTDINVLIIMQSLPPSVLRKAAPIVTWWESVAGALPVLFTREEWRQAGDVFALECADIQQWHHVAYGEDLFGDLTIEPADLRLLCEVEMTRKLLLLRQRWMASQQNAGVQANLLKASVGSFVALFRGVLRLGLPSTSIPAGAGDVLTAMPAVVPGFSAEPFQKILDAHDAANLVNSAELWGSYLGELARVIARLNEPDFLSSSCVPGTVMPSASV